MASERITIYAGEPVERVLAGWADERSGRINAVCDRYIAVITEACPAFTVDEWCFLFGTLNGVWLDARQCARVALEVGDALQFGQGSTWNVDADTFLPRINSMTFAQKAAIVECSERFWRSEGQEGESYAEMFKRLGFPLAD